MFAKEFRVKIEMKQIGSRQESSIIGGIGSCGRELCCSTWKSDFETVTTTAARYQNLAINQTKLTGQCGRLKCCLNYELDTYIDALGDFPKNADTLKIEGGYANLVKTDIFKGIMFYSIRKDNIRGPLLALKKEQVKKLVEINKKGDLIKNITSIVYEKPQEEISEDKIEHDFADVTGQIELPAQKRRRPKNSRRNKNNRNRKRPNKPTGKADNSKSPTAQKEQSNKPKKRPSKNRNYRNKKKSGPNKSNNSDKKDQ